MSFWRYLEDRTFFILFQLVFVLIVFVFLIFLQEDIGICLIMAFSLIFVLTCYLIVDFYVKRRKYFEIIDLVDNCQEKYYLVEILSKPKSLENIAYYYALEEASRAMNTYIGDLEKEQLDFQEYVEGVIHDIKTPLAFLALFFDNNSNRDMQDEVKIIGNKIEQILYFARSGSLEKDYFIKKYALSAILHTVIMDYKNYFLRNGVKLNVHDLEFNVFTDEKWLGFILGQVIQNSIKYFDKSRKILEIWAEEGKANVILYIRDNGCGIKSSDRMRVFDKGFAGSDRSKENSTGIGLYLAKKLCDNLGLHIEINSVYKKFTEITIVFPKGDLHKF